MTPDETMGEVADENGTPPPGFTLEAEASRPDPPLSLGIIERAIEPEPEDDEVPEIVARAPEPPPDEIGLEAANARGEADDDDAIEDPANATPLEDI